MLSEREPKLFLLRTKRFKENKQPISLGISLRLQLLIFKLVKEDKPNRQDNSKPKDSELLDIGLKGRSWNPSKAIFFKVSKIALEEAICLFTSTLLALPKFSSSFEHPKRLRSLSPVKLKKVLGRDIRFFQSLTSNETRPLKFPIDVGSFVIAVPFK